MYFKNILIASFVFASASAASAKSLTCYWLESKGRPSEYFFDAIHAYVFEEQLDGSHVATEQSYLRSSTTESPDGITTKKIVNVKCQFAADSMLTRCVSEAEQVLYSVNLVSETKLNYEGKPRVSNATEVVVSQWIPSQEQETRKRVKCEEHADFAKIVEHESARR